jgi:hypothetical protein
MPAKSKAQRRLMAMCEKGKATNTKCPKMSKEKMHEYAMTKEKGLPKKKKR